MSNYRITAVASPELPSDAATKAYVDQQLVSGVPDIWINETGDIINGTLNFSGVTVDIATPGAEDLVLMPGGNVGIGTTNPKAKLEVVGGDIRLGNNEALQWWNNVNNDRGAEIFVDSSNNLVIGSQFDDRGWPRAIIFETGAHPTPATERMRIDENGNIGIGTSSPVGRLAVRGDGTNPILSLYDGTGAEKVTVLNNGNVGIGTTNPKNKLEVIGTFNASSNNGALSVDNEGNVKIGI